ncbi:hypothetical protein [Bacteriophage sp.]|nr:hypothetical protein [Bacteriophage sp.]
MGKQPQELPAPSPLHPPAAVALPPERLDASSSLAQGFRRRVFSTCALTAFASANMKNPAVINRVLSHFPVGGGGNVHPPVSVAMTGRFRPGAGHSRIIF